jgi:NADH:ubiquinone oxidoreductase subunit 3 (subunit A)
VQPTSGHFLPVIITFSALAFVAILVVIFGVIIRRRKESIKKQRPKNENHENEFDFDDGSRYYEGINDRNEENSYEMINYYGINYNKSNIESNSSKTVVYLDISK